MILGRGTQRLGEGMWCLAVCCEVKEGGRNSS